MRQYKLSALQARRNLQCTLFVLPALVLIVAFYLLPMFQSFAFSLTNWDGFSYQMKWVGLTNFRKVVMNDYFPRVAMNTFYLMVLQLPILNILALILALGFQNMGKLSTTPKALFFFPSLLASPVIGFIWQNIYRFDGMLNNTLKLLGLPGLRQDWLGQASTVLPSISVVIIWQGMGWTSLIYLAGLVSIPQEVNEAAQMDGIKPVRRLLSITLPMLIPSITVNAILGTIGALNVFDIVLIMTKGGPASFSETIALAIFNYAYSKNRIEYGLALAVLLGTLTIGLALVQLALLRRRERETT